MFVDHEIKSSLLDEYFWTFKIPKPRVAKICGYCFNNEHKVTLLPADYSTEYYELKAIIMIDANKSVKALSPRIQKPARRGLVLNFHRTTRQVYRRVNPELLRFLNPVDSFVSTGTIDNFSKIEKLDL